MSIRIEFGVENVKRVLGEFEAFKKATAKQAEKAMVAGAEYVKKESQKRCPVRTGRLRRSAFVRSRGDGWNTRVSVGYSVPYAIYVHERLELLHRNGEAKFLENVFREQSPQIYGVILREMGRKKKNAK